MVVDNWQDAVWIFKNGGKPGVEDIKPVYIRLKHTQMWQDTVYNSVHSINREKRLWIKEKTEAGKEGIRKKFRRYPQIIHSLWIILRQPNKLSTGGDNFGDNFLQGGGQRGCKKVEGSYTQDVHRATVQAPRTRSFSGQCLAVITQNLFSRKKQGFT